jgi:hypothetical protein
MLSIDTLMRGRSSSGSAHDSTNASTNQGGLVFRHSGAAGQKKPRSGKG